jgi:pimeloyl-ACP methyl ester carboxylesterase
MSWLARSSFLAARISPDLLNFLVGQPLTLLSKYKPRLLINALATLNGEPDKHCLLEAEALNAFLHSLPACFTQGARGALQDLIMFQQPWTLPFSSITLPVHMWHGDHDNVVPFRHSEYLAAQLGNAHMNCVPGEGHFSLPLRHMRRLLTDFLEQTEKKPA